MTREEILRIVEAVEAELGDGSTDHYPAPDTITEGRLRELCRAVQRLVARLEKLEAVAEAAREVVRGSVVELKQSDGWERRCIWGPQWEHLAKSLAALEEDTKKNDDDQSVFALKPRQGIKMVAVRRDYLDKLKAVAEAAREFVDVFWKTYGDRPGCEGCFVGEVREIERALAALEEVDDGTES